MRRILFLACVEILTAALAAAATRAFPPALDAYIEKARSDWGVPGLAVVVVDGEGIVGAKGYGVRRLGAPETIDENTHFDIASLSKSFNAAMIATLVDEGKLHWDDRVRDVAPQIVFPDSVRDSETTLRDLLAHRVALENGNLLIRLSGYDQAETFRRIRYFRPRGAFRADFVYSNILYSVSEAMARAVTGKSWSALVRERLLVPLGMSDTNADENLDLPDAASPHARIDGVQQPVRHFRFATVPPASGIVSTPKDLATWLRFQLGDGTWSGKRIVSEASMEEMHSPQMLVSVPSAVLRSYDEEFFATYGFGWNVIDYRGRMMLWHSGNADGMPSGMAVLPREKIGVAVLVNSWEGSGLPWALTKRILDTLLELPLRDGSATALAERDRGEKRDAGELAERERKRVAGTHPSVGLDAYAGVYVDRVFGDMAITRDGDHLVLQFAHGQFADLFHWQYDTFAVRWRDPVFREDYPVLATFSLNDEGKPVRLEIPIRRDRIEAVR